MSTLKGLRELEIKLRRMESKTAQGVLRSALRQSATPTIRKMRAAAPVGTRTHRTYKGRLVAPGFLSRSVRTRSKIVRGHNRTTAVVQIGVLDEAYYGLQYVERGTKKMPARPWFTPIFEADSDSIATRFAEILRRKIEAAS